MAQAAQAAVNAGIFYCSAAGNEAQEHYEADFNGAGPLTVAGVNLQNVHDFGGGDFFANVQILFPGFITVHLQWSNPFGASNDNYDLLLFDSGNNQQVAAGTTVQDGDDNPQEIVSIIAFQPTDVNLVLNRVSGSDARLEMFVRGIPQDDPDIFEFSDPAGSIFGHPAVAGVFAAGGMDANDPGSDNVNVFSSQGPSLILFPAQENRPKPDGAAG